MDKKNYLWIAIGVIAVVIALLLVIKTTDKPNIENSPELSGEVNMEETDLNDEDEIIPSNITEAATPTPVPSDIMPLAEESVLKVDGDNFTPKTIRAKSGEKVFITLSAQDDASHTFGFTSEALSFIVMKFDKTMGNQSATFPAPQVGTYTYYIDDTTNTGKLIIE